MTAPFTAAVIGAAFGDEGKGLATDLLCRQAPGALVVRHNGGAQAGHTVGTGAKRFVFHQLSAGSFRGADTFWAGSFLPDLYKLPEELADFRALAGFSPRVFADPDAGITLVDDVLLNMALETSRGENRHGSCGMGINEATERGRAGFRVTLGMISGMTAASLTALLSLIRRDYALPRLSSFGLTPETAGEYGTLLTDPNVPARYAEGVLRMLEAVRLVPDPDAFLQTRQAVIFEGAQGLLLDAENRNYAPHVTASRTGLTNPLRLCRAAGRSLDLALYVARSYLTRHGAGPLPGETAPSALGELSPDETNRENPWQGRLRYARHPSPAGLAAPILDDLGDWDGNAALFVTHLNETEGLVRFASGDLPPAALAAHPAFGGRLSFVGASSSKTDGALPLLCGGEKS